MFKRGLPWGSVGPRGTVGGEAVSRGPDLEVRGLQESLMAYTSSPSSATLLPGGSRSMNHSPLLLSDVAARCGELV